MSAFDVAGAATGGTISVLALAILVWAARSPNTDWRDETIGGAVVVTTAGLASLCWAAFCIARIFGASL
jgi:protein-S-isoprenylcysteine O-methyltransferase Ste14